MCLPVYTEYMNTNRTTTQAITVGTSVTFVDYRDTLRAGTVVELIEADLAVVLDLASGDKYRLDLGEDDYTVVS